MKESRYMKRLAVLLSIALFCCCEAPESPTIKPPVAAPEEDKGNNEGGNNEITGSEYYIVDDIDDPLYWVTNEYMQAFMEKVTYKDRD